MSELSAVLKQVSGAKGYADVVTTRVSEASQRASLIQEISEFPTSNRRHTNVKWLDIGHKLVPLISFEDTLLRRFFPTSLL